MYTSVKKTDMIQLRIPASPLAFIELDYFLNFALNWFFSSSLAHFMMEKYSRLCSVESAHNDKGKMGDLDPFMCPLESL